MKNNNLKEFCKKLRKKMEFYFQSNFVKNSLVASLNCPKANSATHCLTKLFPIYQNKRWTIRWRDDHTILYWRLADFYTGGRGKLRRPWGYGLVVFSLAMISSSTIGPPPGSFCNLISRNSGIKGRTDGPLLHIYMRVGTLLGFLQKQ